MARVIRFYKDSQTQFVKLFSLLLKSKSNWEAWHDFITMAAIAISNVFDRQGPIHDAREEEYLGLIKRYDKADQQIFSQLLAAAVQALEAEPEQDFLGTVFMGLNLGDHWKGQFFTPYNICKMIAETQFLHLEERVKEKGWVGIHDPCCGAGALLIAARNAMVRKKLGPANALYVAQDMDRTAALMCYIQLALLGCAGYVVVADSICHPLVGIGSSPLLIPQTPEQEVWMLPALYDETWCARIQVERMKAVLSGMNAALNSAHKKMERKINHINQTATAPMEPFPLTESSWGQFSLF